MNTFEDPEDDRGENEVEARRDAREPARDETLKKRVGGESEKQEALQKLRREILTEEMRLPKKSGRFDREAVALSPEQKTYGLTGALRMPGFQLPPGQTYSAKFEIWAGPKIYHRRP